MSGGYTIIPQEFYPGLVKAFKTSAPVKVPGIKTWLNSVNKLPVLFDIDNAETKLVILGCSITKKPDVTSVLCYGILPSIPFTATVDVQLDDTVSIRTDAS